MNIPVDFIIDFESFGFAPQCAVIDLAVLCFKDDPNSPPTFEQLCDSATRVKFDISSQKTGNINARIFDDSTIKWWANQSPEAKFNLRASPSDVSLETGVNIVEEFLSSNGVNKKESFGYARGVGFDFGIMVDIIRQITGKRETMNEEWCRFWNQRDVRTSIEKTLMTRGMTECPLPMGTLDGFVAHDSIHDCARDVLMMIYAQRYALGLETCPTEDIADPNSIKKARG